MEPYALRVEGLDFSIGSKRILKNISLDIPKGVFAGIIGANGAGKTTLLKCLNHIHEKNSGKIFVEGKELKDYGEKALAASVSLMHQNTNLDFDFTCGQVVEFGRYPYWKKGYWAGTGDKEIVRQKMEYTRTLDMAGKNITEISGGERQRVLFAKLLAQDTDIVLLDEPTANMDIYYQKQIFEMGRHLTGEGRTVVAAVHDLNLALEFCTHFYLLSQGELLAQGRARDVITPKHLKEAYRMDTLVYENPLTGCLQVFRVERTREREGEWVHIQCENGFRGSLMYDAWRKGADVTCSPAADGSLNRWAAQVLGLDMLTEDELSDRMVKNHKKFIRVVV